MKRASIVVALITLSLSGISEAQQITNPIRYTWIATSCPNWSCAVAALVQAEGKPNVIVLPTGRDTTPWIILKRVEEGSIFIPEDEPYRCEVFVNVGEAAGAFASMDRCHGPLMLSMVDGNIVIASLSKCDEPNAGKRRSVR